MIKKRTAPLLEGKHATDFAVVTKKKKGSTMQFQQVSNSYLGSVEHLNMFRGGHINNLSCGS